MPLWYSFIFSVVNILTFFWLVRSSWERRCTTVRTRSVYGVKLHFIIHVPDYTLHHKLFKCTICTLNYYYYHTLHSGVTFSVMFDEFYCTWQVHASCLGGINLKDWNTYLQIQLKQRQIFSTSLCFASMPLPNSDSSQNLRFHPTHLTHHAVPLSVWRGWDNPLYFFPCTCTKMEEI